MQFHYDFEETYFRFNNNRIVGKRFLKKIISNPLHDICVSYSRKPKALQIYKKDLDSSLEKMQIDFFVKRLPFFVLN